MGMITSKCPQCGESIIIDEGRDFVFCTYCAFRIEKKKPVPLPATAPTAETLLKKAQTFLDNKNYPNARIFFNSALDINPHLSEAYWGLTLCRFSSYDTNMRIEDCNDYKNALKFAESEEIKQEYIAVARQIQSEIDSIYDAHKENLENVIIRLHRAVSVLNILKIVFAIITALSLFVSLVSGLIFFADAEPFIIFIFILSVSTVVFTANLCIMLAIAGNIIQKILSNKLDEYDSMNCSAMNFLAKIKQ